ncbi:MAG: acyl-CoA desaturase [Planctomycetia bacterium]|nr:acyl-CoA desaturase [Planctomycetia bacterium]
MSTSPTAGNRLAVSAAPPKFPKDSDFQSVLVRRVQDYFSSTGRYQRDCPRMYLKTAIILATFFSSYILLVFFATSWYFVLPLAIILSLAVAAIGFNIQHDAGHHAYSNYAWINKIMSWTMDMVGGSSYMWHWKHGVFHHTYTNISGHDTDIELGFLGRLSPHQKRYSFHRWQQYYLWPLYGFVVFKWHLFDDFQSYITGKIGENRIPRPKGGDLLVFIIGKLVFFSLAFIIPMFFCTWWMVLLFYGLVIGITGIILSVVFQLAHCDEKAEFPLPAGDTGRMENAWAVHQVSTTVDFAQRSRVLTWLLGGLNYQIEHHLFPRICHTNYPAISRIVQQVCQEFGLRYNVHTTFWGAMVAHYHWLRQMGRPQLALAS